MVLWLRLLQRFNEEFSMTFITGILCLSLPSLNDFNKMSGGETAEDTSEKPQIGELVFSAN